MSFLERVDKVIQRLQRGGLDAFRLVPPGQQLDVAELTPTSFLYI